MKTKSATAASNGRSGSNGKQGKSTGGRNSAATKSAGSKTATKSTAKKQQSSSSSDSETATGLRELYVDMLKDLYWAEKALTKALPKMAKKATSEELVSALQDHLAVTQEQVSRLEQVFEIAGKKAQAKKCEAMDGLIKEAEELMESTEEGVVRDAAIIAASQKVEHYEIASYGTLVSFAKTLGEDEAMELLEETLNEEKEADQLLTTVAESAVNIEAAEEDEEEDEDDEDEDEDEDEEDDEEEDSKPMAKGRATAGKR